MLCSCVRTGTVYGEEYVIALWEGLKANMPCEFDFMCFTDQFSDKYPCSPVTLPGWWAKIELFKTRMPMLFFDLDIIITNNLLPVTLWEGFGIIKDWNDWGPEPSLEGKTVTPMFNSSVMKLTGDEYHVWEQFKPVVMDRFKRGGDQRWITARMPDAKTFPPEWFASYKVSKCVDQIPKDSLAVVFHGHPKPHEIKEGWVPNYWPRRGEMLNDSATQN